MRQVLLGVLFGTLLQAASVDLVVTTGIVNAPVSEVWKVWTTQGGNRVLDGGENVD